MIHGLRPWVRPRVPKHSTKHVNKCQQHTNIEKEQAKSIKIWNPKNAEPTESSIGLFGRIGSGNTTSTKPVGQKAPNTLGFYDMSGNIYEWCNDIYLGSYYSDRHQIDPVNLARGRGRSVRGGNWYYGATFCRVSERGWRSPSKRSDRVGFRVLRRTPK